MDLKWRNGLYLYYKNHHPLTLGAPGLAKFSGNNLTYVGGRNVLDSVWLHQWLRVRESKSACTHKPVKCTARAFLAGNNCFRKPISAIWGKYLFVALIAPRAG